MSSSEYGRIINTLKEIKSNLNDLQRKEEITIRKHGRPEIATSNNGTNLNRRFKRKLTK